MANLLRSKRLYNTFENSFSGLQFANIGKAIAWQKMTSLGIEIRS